MRYMKTTVSIRSTQTNRIKGELIRMEYDHRFGEQYLIKTYHPDWGEEYFWMRENEVRFQR